MTGRWQSLLEAEGPSALFSSSDRPHHPAPPMNSPGQLLNQKPPRSSGEATEPLIQSHDILNGIAHVLFFIRLQLFVVERATETRYRTIDRPSAPSPRPRVLLGFARMAALAAYSRARDHCERRRLRYWRGMYYGTGCQAWRRARAIQGPCWLGMNVLHDWQWSWGT